MTDARLKAAASDSGWLMYRRDYTSRGYAPFKTIDTGNVANLKPAWDWKSDFDMGHEAPPIVNGDYLFITTPKNHLIAFQASTGKKLWEYAHDLSNVGLKTICCDVVNRGVALYEDKVYMATLDNHVVALNAQKPLDFSSFPTVLLFATLFRLGLNVASTRIILLEGHTGSAAAGRVVEAFGHFLVGGNFAIGICH